MSVPSFLDKLKPSPAPLAQYLALYISDERVQAAVWQPLAGKTEIVSLGTPVEWDGDVATTNELISAVDATISSATEGLDSDPEEIVFGLAHNWVELSGIKPSKKDLLKNICRELSLKPIGYVVSTNAIVKYIKMQEGAPPSSLLIQLDRKTVTVSLVELGNITYTLTVPSSSHIAEDVAEALTRLPQDNTLPSRFIVVSAMENISDIVQSLTAYDYQEQFSFLHTPKIEALPKDVEVHATAIGGGSEVSQSLGFTPDQPTPPAEAVPETSVAPTSESTPSPVPASAFGFQPQSATEATALTSQPDPEPEITEPTPSIVAPASSRISLPQLPHFSLPNFTLPKFPTLPKLKFNYLFLLFPLLLIIFVGAMLFLLPTATITLYVQAKPLNETVNLTLDPNQATPDPVSRLVPVSRTTESETTSQTLAVSGKKTIGDPSRGEIVLYNRTTLPKTLSKGTQLTANNLRFTLDSDVTIASKSAGADYVDVPGKATAKITAATFGDAGNLKAGTEFSIASFSKDTYVGKNESALTGGNSREVTIFSEADRKTLEQQALTALLQQIKDNYALDTTVETQTVVIEDTAKITTSDYSAKIGEEASSVTAEMTLEVEVITYQVQDVRSLVESELGNSVPAGFTPAPLPPEIVIEDITDSSSSALTATANVTVYAMPTLESEALGALLKGKSRAKAESLLATLPNVVRSNIVISPPRLPFLPLNPRRLTINLTPAK